MSVPPPPPVGVCVCVGVLYLLLRSTALLKTCAHMPTQHQWYHFGLGAAPILEPSLVVGLGCSLGANRVWTHSHIPFGEVPQTGLCQEHHSLAAGDENQLASDPPAFWGRMVDT